MSWLPEPIGDEVRREFRRFGPESALADVVAAWPAAVGPSIAANAWPSRIARDRTLHVATSSSAWAFELTQLAGTVLARLQEHLAVDCPTAVRFAVGHLPEAGGDSEASLSETVPKPDPATLTEAQRIAEGIAGEALRKAVARAAAASLAARRGAR